MNKYVRFPGEVRAHRDYMIERFQKAPDFVIHGECLIGPDYFYGGWNLNQISAHAIQLYVVDHTIHDAGGGHKHEIEDQAYYVVRGRANVKIGEGMAQVSAGGVAYAPSGLMHGYGNSGPDTLTMLDIHAWHFPGERMTKLELTEFTRPPGSVNERHSHADREEAYFIVSGQASVNVGDEEVTVTPGAGVYFPRNVEHGYRVTGSEPFKYLLISNSDV